MTAAPLLPDDPAERDLIAGDYVLGVTDAATRAALTLLLSQDADFRDRVSAWEARLAPLAALAPPMPPPTGLWPRIAGHLRGSPIIDLDQYRRALRRVVAWQVATGLTAAVAAGLGFWLLLAPAPQNNFVAVLTPASAEPAAFLVESGPHASDLVLTALTDRKPAPGRSYELWAAIPGAARPVSLGVIPENGRITIRPAQLNPKPGIALLISLEPQGGSPTGLPTGPVVFQGQLAVIGL